MSEHLIQIAPTLKWLLFCAWILPLAGFARLRCSAVTGERSKSKLAAYMAVGCIATGFILSSMRLSRTWYGATHHDDAHAAEAP